MVPSCPKLLCISINNKYLQIKKKCLKAGEKWTDPEFGPNEASLWEGEPKKEVEWKRVHVGRTLWGHVTCVK